MAEQLDGVRVEDRAELGGRTLVAARAFAVGDVVLAEAPLLRWTDDAADSGGAFLAAVAAAPAAVAEALSEFARPALDTDSPVVRARGEFAAQWLAAHPDAPAGWTHAHVHGLCLVADTNAHTFLGDAAAATRESQEQPARQLALFRVGSKAAHACRPNTLYSSKAGGVLRYVATQPIAAGEPVLFSYLSGVARPREARRAQLRLSKHFECRCVRCAGADDCRGLRCAAAGCGAVALHADGGAWACTACGAALEGEPLAAALRAEAALTARLSSLEAALRDGSLMRRSPTELRSLGAQAAEALAPTHWVAARAAELLVTFAASHRQQLESALAAAGRPRAAPAPAPWPGGAVVSSAFFRALGGAAALTHIRCCECIAARCTGGAKCAPGAPPRHAPEADSASAALWAVADLRAAGGADRAAAARRLAAHYLPLLRAAYGAEDENVREVAAWLEEASAAAAQAPAAPPGPQVSAFCALPQCSALEAQPGAFKTCAACGGPRYCGPACQRAHWKAHKKSCTKAPAS
jgi:hypothetical protein